MSYHDRVIRQALEALQAARRDYQAEYDATTLALASTGPVPNEQETQTLGAIARQLDNAARELRDALASVRQLERLRAELSASTGK